MAIINTGSFPKLIYPGVRTWYATEYNKYSPQWPDLFEKTTSSRAFEEEVGFSGLGLLQVKAEGGGINYDTARQGFTVRYTPTVFALGFTITREMYEDDQYGVIGKKKAEFLAFSAQQTKEINGANVFNRAFNASYTGGDGVSMVNASHANVAGGTQSNTLATNANFSEAALEQAVIDIMGFTDDRGLRIALNGQSLHIPKDLSFEAERVLRSDLRVGTPNNDPNALRLMGKFPKGVFVNQYLTSSTAWFIRTDAKNGTKYVERRGDNFDMENDFDTENAKFKVTGRYTFGWTDWRQVYGAQGF